MQVRVIGAYLPRLDQGGIARFIADDVSRFKATLLGFVAEGRFKLDAEEIESRALELPAELDADLQRCALFEVEVTGNATEFDPSDFTNPETGYAGWEPAFLTLDGDAIITESYRGVSESLCVRHSMATWSMNATQEENRSPYGQCGAAAILSRSA